MSASKKDAQASSYSKRLKDNVKSILENYGEILRASKVSQQVADGRTVAESQVSHVENEVAVRAANIVRAAEALSKLVSDLKENLILNDFSSINEATAARITELEKLRERQLEKMQTEYSTAAAEARNLSVGVSQGLAVGGATVDGSTVAGGGAQPSSKATASVSGSERPGTT